MNYDFPAYPVLERVANELGDVRADLVFVGGAVIGLYLTDIQVREPRSTEDVDVICEAMTYVELSRFGERLRGRGFTEALDSPVICRWRKGDLVVDLMPIGEDALGFSNRWYGLAFREATGTLLRNGMSIRIPMAPALLACKIEAFLGRGRSDFYASKDFEDIVLLIDGRIELHDELARAPADLRTYVGLVFGDWIRMSACIEGIGGHLPPDPASQARRSIVIDRMSAIPNLTQT